MAKKNKSRNRERPLGRRPPSLDPRPRILVVCEGKVTEPRYLRAFCRQEENRLVDVVIDDQSGVPKTLVERAVALKKASEEEARRERDENLKYDEVWCVFDVDEHPHIPDARQQARAHKIRLAISNPCFELWLLLHFREQSAHLERYVAARLLKTHLPDYQKDAPFEAVRESYANALKRAQQLDKRQSDNGTKDGNPSTGVYRLTEHIRAHGKTARSRH